jgi:hypothetical protein
LVIKGGGRNDRQIQSIGDFGAVDANLGWYLVATQVIQQW